MSRRGQIFARRAWPLLLLAACTRPPDAAGWTDAAPAAGGERTITVVGTGRLCVPPTIVAVDAVVVTESPAPEAAWSQGVDRVFKLTRALEAAGVPASDVTPIASDLRGTGASYRLVQRLRVTVRNLQSVSGVLATCLGNGAQSVEGVRFGLHEPRAAGDRARERALQDAGDKARILAQELQLRLGVARSVEELPPPPPPAAAGTLQEPTPELEVTSTLRVTYALLE